MNQITLRPFVACFNELVMNDAWEDPAVRRTQPISIDHRPKLLEQPLPINCYNYNGYTVNNNNMHRHLTLKRGRRH